MARYTLTDEELHAIYSEQIDHDLREEQRHLVDLDRANPDDMEGAADASKRSAVIKRLDRTRESLGKKLEKMAAIEKRFTDAGKPIPERPDAPKALGFKWYGEYKDIVTNIDPDVRMGKKPPTPPGKLK